MSVRTLVLASVLASALVAGCSDWAALRPDPDQGLVAAVPLDDPAAFRSGPAALTVVGTEAAEGGGLRFDGADDHVVVSLPDPIAVGTSYTVMAWFDGEGAVVSCLADTRFLLRSEAGELEARTYDALGAGFDEYRVVAPLEPGGHHAAVTVEGRAVRLLVDGVLVTEQTVAEPPAGEEPTVDCLIGRSGDPADEMYFSGTIDDVRVHDFAQPDDAIGWFIDR